MRTRSIANASLVAGSLLLLACSISSSGLNTNGYDGSAGQGGTGAGTGGTTHKASGGNEGGVGGSGGHSGGLGGSHSTGGNGGGNSGGNHGSTGGNNGTGGTQCIPPPCALPICQYGTAPAPPCGCGSCLPGPDGGIDGGSSRDASKDLTSADTRPCLPVACPALLCRYGYVPSPTPCGCPTCVPADASLFDANSSDGSTVCPPIVCPLLACPVGAMSSPTACGCPTCGLQGT
jgi:hypothetical protein